MYRRVGGHAEKRGKGRKGLDLAAGQAIRLLGRVTSMASFGAPSVNRNLYLAVHPALFSVLGSGERLGRL